MALSDGLMNVAISLVPTGRGRPDQAALRRSVSTAYYAVFHKLIERSSDEIVGVTREPSLRHVVSRAFEHGSMKELCRSLKSGNTPALLKAAIPIVPADLRLVASVFEQLQGERHEADYNPSRPFTKSRAQRGIDSARRVLDALDPKAVSNELRRFLVLLPLWKQLKTR